MDYFDTSIFLSESTLAFIQSVLEGNLTPLKNRHQQLAIIGAPLNSSTIFSASLTNIVLQI